MKAKDFDKAFEDGKDLTEHLDTPKLVELIKMLKELILISLSG